VLSLSRASRRFLRRPMGTSADLLHDRRNIVGLDGFGVWKVDVEDREGKKMNLVVKVARQLDDQGRPCFLHDWVSWPEMIVGALRARQVVRGNLQLHTQLRVWLWL